MKNVLKITISILLLVAVFGAGYRYRDDIYTRFLPFAPKISALLGIRNAPCAEPIPYTLGSFNDKFHISKSYFLDALKEAEALWEEPFGKDLFVHMSDGVGDDALRINLIYDYRQDATNKLSRLGIVVEENRASYDQLKAKYGQLKIEFASAKADYDVRVKDFNTRQKIYEEQVKYWNAKGGAPEEEFERLERERIELVSEASKLSGLLTEVNETVDEVNAMVAVLNRLASALKISVETYNTVGATRGESFTEGVYSNDGVTREIDIYEFSNRAKLVRVLTHELGHALGLEHVEDPKAIMYSLNQGNSGVLTQTDLDALKAQCELTIS